MGNTHPWRNDSSRPGWRRVSRRRRVPAGRAEVGALGSRNRQPADLGATCGEGVGVAAPSRGRARTTFGWTAGARGGANLRSERRDGGAVTNGNVDELRGAVPGRCRVDGERLSRRFGGQEGGCNLYTLLVGFARTVALNGCVGRQAWSTHGLLRDGKQGIGGCR